MPAESTGGRRRAKATAPASPPPAPPPLSSDEPPAPRYRSAAELLADLLPQLTRLAGTTLGRGKAAAWRKLYLEALSHCACVSIAARIAGVSRSTVRCARAEPEFAEAEREAMENAVDLIEASAFKSAVYGDLQPVYHQGVVCGHVLKYSDAMRALLLKGRRSEVYRDKVDVEHAGAVAQVHLTRAEWKQRMREAKA